MLEQVRHGEPIGVLLDRHEVVLQAETLLDLAPGHAHLAHDLAPISAGFMRSTRREPADEMVELPAGHVHGPDADREARPVVDHDRAVAVEDRAARRQHGDGAQAVVVGLGDVLLGRQDLQEPQTKDDDADQPDGDDGQQHDAQGDRRRLHDLAVAAAGADPAAPAGRLLRLRYADTSFTSAATSAPRGRAAPRAGSRGRAAG